MGWRGVNGVSCRVTVGVDVTGIDVSSTGSRNFHGDLLRAVCRQAFTVLVEAPEIMVARRQERKEREGVPRVKSPSPWSLVKASATWAFPSTHRKNICGLDKSSRIMARSIALLLSSLDRLFR